MTFGEACRKLREQGYTNLWDRSIWDKRPPITMTDEYIAKNENRAAEKGEWQLNGNVVVFVRRSDEKRLEVYSAA